MFEIAFKSVSDLDLWLSQPRKSDDFQSFSELDDWLSAPKPNLRSVLDLSFLYRRDLNKTETFREKLENPTLFSQEELDDLALICLADLETFFLVMFLAVDGYLPQIRPFHRVIFDVLERVRRLEILRLLINIPPGFGKTHVLKMWTAQSYMIEPRCRFLHLSYSQRLVEDNSDDIKLILQTPIARAISEVVFRSDARGKALWKTTDGGIFRAASTGGQVTGFRAGRLGFYGDDEPETVEETPLDRAGLLGVEEFCGAAEIDDPIKPEDVNSVVLRDKINNRYPQTIASRLATERVPIVGIMQRTDGMDLSGFLLGGGSGEKWHLLIIPDEITEEDLDPSKYSEFEKVWLYGIPVQHNLPLGPIWPEKLDSEGSRVKRQNDYTYQAQYRQRPRPKGGKMFRRDWFPRYKSIDGWNGYIESYGQRITVEYYMVFSDTAQKTEERHDFSVMQLYAKLADGRIALVDLIRGKWEAPELQSSAIVFLDRYEYQPHHWVQSWRQCLVEDKVSGTGLIQHLKRKYHGRVEGKQRNRDKYVRACDAQPHIQLGQVLVPEEALWLEDFLTEVEQFARDLNHEHDDQCDCLFDACEEMLDRIDEADYSQFGS